MSKKIVKPLPTHNRVHFDKREVVAVVGPWGSGKSTIGAIELAGWCRKYNCDALVVRDTYPALRDSCCKKWIELFEGQGEMHWGPPPTWHWTNEMKGLQVLFRSAESPEDIQKFGSVEVGAAWLEEVTPGLMPGGALNIGMAPEVLSGVLGRIRKWGEHPYLEGVCEPKGSGKACNHKKLFVTALPPPTTRHWFHRLFYDRMPFQADVAKEVIEELTKNISLYRIHPKENADHLPENYYQLQTAFLTSEDQIQRFINGEVGSAYSGAGVYAEQWNDEHHINSKIEPTPGPMLLGIDGGLDASAVWVQIQTSGRLFVLAELCTHGLGLEDFGMLVQQRGAELFGPRSYNVWTDPAIFSRSQNNARDGAWYLHQAGLTAKPSIQKPDVRVGAVRSWLGRFGRTGPLVQVHPRCEILIEGFRGAYRWKLSSGIPIIGSIEKNEFCIIPDTKVLTSDLRWIPAHKAQVGDTLYAFSESLNGKVGEKRRWRKIQKASILDIRHLEADIVSFETDDGFLSVSFQHRLLAAPPGRHNLAWHRAIDIQPGWRIAHLCKPWERESTYEAGWLAGMFDGEGCFSVSKKESGYSSRIELAQRNGPTLERAKTLLLQRNFSPSSLSSHHWENGVKLVITKHAEIMRLLGTIRPQRLLTCFEEKVFDRWSLPAGNQEVRNVIYPGREEVIGIHTSTGTLFTDGFASHNSHPHDALQYALAPLLHLSQGHAEKLPPLGNLDFLGRGGTSGKGLSKYTRKGY